MENNLIQLIKKVLVDFPTLSLVQSEDGVEIRLKDSSVGPDEDEDLVGTYSQDALDSEQLSEDDIREDCSEFLKGR